MEKLIFNEGLKKYEVNDSGAVFSFAANDANLYSRVKKLNDEALKILKELEKLQKKAQLSLEDEELKNEYVEKFSSAMKNADEKMKQALTECFGKQNDFEAIFSGVNAFSITDTGEFVITNFLNAITPIVKRDTERNINVAAAKKAASMKHHKKK